MSNFVQTTRKSLDQFISYATNSRSIGGAIYFGAGLYIFPWEKLADLTHNAAQISSSTMFTLSAVGMFTPFKDRRLGYSLCFTAGLCGFFTMALSGLARHDIISLFTVVGYIPIVAAAALRYPILKSAKHFPIFATQYEAHVEPIVGTWLISVNALNAGAVYLADNKPLALINILWFIGDVLCNRLHLRAFNAIKKRCVSY